MSVAELASIAKFISDATGVNSIAFDKVKDGFIRPSLFIPTAEISMYQPAIGMYDFENALFVKVFADSTKIAMDIANDAVLAISQSSNKIPLLNEAGEKNGIRTVRLKTVNTKSIDEGVAQIYIVWNSKYRIAAEDYIKAAKIISHFCIKKE